MKRRRSWAARATDTVVGTLAHYGALTAVFVGAGFYIVKRVAVERLRRDAC